MQKKIADTKTRIMDATKRLFYTQGYNSTGINQIIAEAGIAKASLYQHFRSKDDLLIAYLEEKHRERLETLHKFLEKYKSPEEKITGMFDYRIKKAKEHMFQGCCFVRISAEIDMSIEKGKVKAAIKKHKNEMLRLIRSLVDACELTTGLNRKKLSDRIFLIYEGGGMSSTLFQSIAPLEEAKSLVKEILK